MNGAQDLGGMMGFGPVAIEADEPWFHAAWERRAFGITLAIGATGTWNLDMSRHARESLHPADYLMSSYYEIWTKGVEKLVVQTGLVSEEELQARHALTPPRSGSARPNSRRGCDRPRARRTDRAPGRKAGPLRGG
jgi:hypothetical protein